MNRPSGRAEITEPPRRERVRAERNGIAASVRRAAPRKRLLRKEAPKPKKEHADKANMRRGIARGAFFVGFFIFFYPIVCFCQHRVLYCKKTRRRGSGTCAAAQQREEA